MITGEMIHNAYCQVTPPRLWLTWSEITPVAQATYAEMAKHLNALQAAPLEKEEEKAHEDISYSF